MFSDESASSCRQLYFVINKTLPTVLMLSGLGNTTLVNAATDAANAFRVCHIGKFVYKIIKRDLKQYLYFHSFVIKSPIWRLRADLAVSMAAIKTDMYVNPLIYNNE